LSKNRLNRPESVTTDDGRVVELKPLKISGLRRFMDRFGEIAKMDVPDGVELINVLQDCAAISVEKHLPEETAYLKKGRAEGWEAVTDEDREAFGDLFDMEQVSLINKVCGGVSFDDPNLLAEAQAAAETPEDPEVGTT
jgi:hypothetical protein